MEIRRQPLQKSQGRRKRSEYPRFLLSNVRCLTNKMDEVRLLLGRHNLDFTVFTESWLDNSVSDAAVNVDGFKPVRRDRVGSRGGGIITYLKEDLCASLIGHQEVPSLQSCESEFLILFIEKYELLLVTIYHAFWNNVTANDRAISCITDIIDFGLLKYGPRLRVILCGDFNDLRHHYADISRLTLLKSLVDFPTRGLNCLDQVFTNFATDCKPICLPPLGLSDHSVVFWQPCLSSSPPVKKIRVRRMTHAHLSSFMHAVAEYDWVKLAQSCDSLDESASLFTNCLFNLFDCSFPLKTVRIRHDEPKWMKPSLKILINDRDRAFFNGQVSKYSRLRNEVISHVRFLKSNFINSSVSSNNSKRTWSALRLISGHVSTSSQRCAETIGPEAFNRSFVSNFQSSSELLEQFVLPVTGAPSLVTEREVLSFLKKVPNKSCGPDGIPPWIFRRCALFLCPAVTYLFNRSLQECHVPSCFKLANVVPIPKTKTTKLASDFRPISLLPILSKIFEKVIVKKFILPFISERIDHSQFAYVSRPGSGVTSALVLAYHKVVEFLDKSSGAVRLLSVDFSKAFDKLLHSRIISACVDFQLPPFVIKWIISFLSCRKQRVFVNGRTSTWSEITSGVPQGSTLGPILFCLAVNSLSNICPNSSIVKYADDVSIFHFVRDSSEDRLQAEWDNVVHWSEAMNLPLNFLKCHVIDFVTKRSLSLSPVIMSDNNCLNEVSSMSFLGVTLSNNMKWNAHVDKVVNKAIKRLFLLRNLRRAHCPENLMLMCYFSFIRSVLLHAFPSFCNLPVCLFEKLQRVERRALRIIGCTSHVPPLSEVAYKMCAGLMASVELHAEHLLRKMFTESKPSSTRSSNVLRAPFAKTERFRKSFIRFCK